MSAITPVTFAMVLDVLDVVEVDVLTGQVTVLSSFINYDCGVSLNPIVDCGQIEGAFIMGLGYFLTEEVVTADDSGELLTVSHTRMIPPFPYSRPLTSYSSDPCND